MTEQIKKINNPLTIIAIFAALAEINATIAIGLIEVDLQKFFIWFVMIFPTILVAAFFLTLNFNTKVIYSPSDYREDKTFLDSMYGQGTPISTEKSISSNYVKNILDGLQAKMNSIENVISKNVNLNSIQINQLLEEYKSEVKGQSEKLNNESSKLNFAIPIPLTKVLLKMVAFPAYIPIIYCIIKENAASISDMQRFNDKYNLLIGWDEEGIKKLIESGILEGNYNNFVLSNSIKEPLNNWILQNEHLINKVIELYRNEDNNSEETQSEARNITQQFILG